MGAFLRAKPVDGWYLKAAAIDALDQMAWKERDDPDDEQGLGCGSSPTPAALAMPATPSSAARACASCSEPRSSP